MEPYKSTRKRLLVRNSCVPQDYLSWVRFASFVASALQLDMRVGAEKEDNNTMLLNQSSELDLKF